MLRTNSATIKRTEVEKEGEKTLCERIKPGNSQALVCFRAESQGRKLKLYLQCSELLVPYSQTVCLKKNLKLATFKNISHLATWLKLFRDSPYGKRKEREPVRRGTETPVIVSDCPINNSMVSCL